VNDDLIEKLRSLNGRSSSSTLRNLMPVIDPLIKRGVSHDDVITTLSESGMKVNIYTFRSALYAYRKKQRTVGGNPEAAEALVKPAPVLEADNPQQAAKEPSIADELRKAADKYLK